MTGRLAGYSDKAEIGVSGYLEELGDSQVLLKHLELVDEWLNLLAVQVPQIGDVLKNMVPAERARVVEVMSGTSQRDIPILKAEQTE
jgi:hypothetical protein